LAQLFHRVHQTVEEKRNAMTFTLTSKGPRFQDPKTGKFQSPNKLPTCHLVVLPLKLKDATGSPVRAIAFVD